jgi:hypothetical protein
MMEERSSQVGPAERPPGADRSTDGDAVSGGPPHLADPRALTILTTEHWSLLTARSLVYNEAFARGGMFLTFLTGTLVALGFVSQGTGFGTEFLIVTTVLLAFVLVIGFATIGRLATASSEEFRALQGMNRLRHAYLEMVPSLENYFSASRYDDAMSTLSAFGTEDENPLSPLANLLHGLTTMPGMIALINAVVGGALAASVALLFGASTVLGIASGVLAFLALMVLMTLIGLRSFEAIGRRTDVRFPAPMGPPPSDPDP